jgi:hypothetical protein
VRRAVEPRVLSRATGAGSGDRAVVHELLLRAWRRYNVRRVARATGGRMALNGRNALGRFVRGNSGGPGRPKGSRNRLGEEFLSDLYVDWMEHGASVIAEVRERNPVAYLRTVAGLLPQQVGITTVREDVRTMTDEELARALLSAHEVLAAAQAEDGELALLETN